MPFLVSYVLAAQVSSTAPFQQTAAVGVIAACKSDYKKFCAGTKPGGGRIKICLKKNAPKLSLVCKAAILSAVKSKL